MNFSDLVAALSPVFFVLAIGYVAGKRSAFDADQAAGLSKLAINFALPASLFIAITKIPKSLLLQQGSLVLALILAHLGLFFVCWGLLRFQRNLDSKARVLYAMALCTSATPVFGLAVLEPILGPTAAGTVALVALAINTVTPAAVVLLEVAIAKEACPSGTAVATNTLPIGLRSAACSPLLWSPIAGILAVVAGIQLPRPVSASLELIGSATSGVAVFAVGLVLAAHAFRFSRGVVLATLGRLSVQNLVLLLLLHLFDVSSPLAPVSLVCCSFPVATIVVLLAARYRSSESQMASLLLLSTSALVLTVPLILWLTHRWPV